MRGPLLAVTGATGHVGGVITRALLEQRRRVRVIGRSADRLRPFVDLGAEPAVGSIEDAEFLRTAFEGATGLFAMIPPNRTASGFRAFQRRVAEAQSSAVQATGITHVLTLSSVGAQNAEGVGPVNGLHELEESFNRTPHLNVLHLRAAYFMENHLASIPAIKRVGAYPGALEPELAFPQIASTDIGFVAARRLGALDFKGKNVIELLGPRDLSMIEVVRVLGAAAGKPELKYVQLPYDEVRKGMVGLGFSDELAGLYMEMAQAFNEGRARPTQSRSTDTSTPTTIEEFAKEVFAPAFRSA
ncbi:MAG: NAD(P)H-binding protein [Myxococcales bacterium]|nr:NAD(P)H-binding protein [Myxococcales bacterium]